MNEAPDFRDRLQEELVRRCKVNPRYSLRAFARLLQVEPSFLSKLLNRKRRITPATEVRFSARLGLVPSEPPSDHYRPLPLDHFQVISDWYHYAILELITVEGFQPSPRWVARALGISVSEAKAGVERLARIGLLQINPRGQWRNVSGNHTTLGGEASAPALRALQRQVLEKALQALEETPLEERDQSAMTLAIDSTRLPEARRLLRDFRRRFTREMEARGAHDQVFHLSLSFYPVSRRTRKEIKQ